MRIEVRLKKDIPVGEVFCNHFTFIDPPEDDDDETGLVFDPRTSVQWEEWLSVANTEPVPNLIFVPMNNIEYALYFEDDESHVGED